MRIEIYKLRVLVFEEVGFRDDEAVPFVISIGRASESRQNYGDFLF
ncbi:MAG: hypothetical protein N2234_00475 [Planctomycetota bacterium]|nr:hypothetical protein [Planctomycetota bacterium]